MAKYVCDFDQVYQIGEKISSTATELETSVDTYSTNVDSDLTEWTGNAKDAFTNTTEKQVTTAKQDFSKMKELGEFIKSASNSIEDLEERLSNISI